MRNIWTVFKTDLRTLSKCFFACVVVVAIALLPSLYAWLNIYSNWDPYGNTGGISIAVASLDRGYTDNGEYVNKGRDVLEDLKTAASINWVIVDTEQEATDGVYAGDYYAAVVIDEDFSRKMYRMFTDWTGQPAITYYENAKKNAVATKITDTAVETLKRSISENYLEVVISGIMEQSNLLAADLTETDPETAVKGGQLILILPMNNINSRWQIWIWMDKWNFWFRIVAAREFFRIPVFTKLIRMEN